MPDVIPHGKKRRIELEEGQPSKLSHREIGDFERRRRQDLDQQQLASQRRKPELRSVSPLQVEIDAGTLQSQTYSMEGRYNRRTSADARRDIQGKQDKPKLSRETMEANLDDIENDIEEYEKLGISLAKQVKTYQGICAKLSSILKTGGDKLEGFEIIEAVRNHGHVSDFIEDCKKHNDMYRRIMVYIKIMFDQSGEAKKAGVIPRDILREINAGFTALRGRLSQDKKTLNPILYSRVGFITSEQSKELDVLLEDKATKGY